MSSSSEVIHEPDDEIYQTSSPLHSTDITHDNDLHIPPSPRPKVHDAFPVLTSPFRPHPSSINVNSSQRPSRSNTLRKDVDLAMLSPTNSPDLKATDAPGSIQKPNSPSKESTLKRNSSPCPSSPRPRPRLLTNLCDGRIKKVPSPRSTQEASPEPSTPSQQHQQETEQPTRHALS